MYPKHPTKSTMETSTLTWLWRFLILSTLLLIPLPFYNHISPISQAHPRVVASHQSRFNHNPWVYPTTNTPILPRESQRNRAFISSIWSKCRDGLGHRLSMINFELLIAHELNVGYVHRRSTYGSLTPSNDPLAVERLFGWDVKETRDDILQSSCKTIEYDNTGCEGDMQKKKGGPVCRELNGVEEGGLFKRLVSIPTELIDCYVLGKSPYKCGQELRKFGERFAENDTMFQMVPGRCSPDYRMPRFDKTRGWLLGMYWGFHGGRQDKGVIGLLKGSGKTREVGLDEKRVQIAVHVRRGDFMNFTDRVMIGDERYAEVVVKVKRMIDKRYGKKVGMDMHVYSEGVPKNGWYRNNHDVKEMLPVYVTEKGERVDGDMHWEKVLSKLMRRRGIWKEDLKVFTHIASDTVSAIHEMISADFFVGSASGMSLHLVNVYSRGFVILPTTKIVLPKSDGRVVSYHATGEYEHVVRMKDIENIVNIFASRYEF